MIGRSHSYHLDESIFILGALGVFFHLLFSSFDEILESKLNNPRCDDAFSGVPSWAVLSACVPQNGHHAYIVNIFRADRRKSKMPCVSTNTDS